MLPKKYTINRILIFSPKLDFVQSKITQHWEKTIHFGKPSCSDDDGFEAYVDVDLRRSCRRILKKIYSLRKVILHSFNPKLDCHMFHFRR